MIPPHTVCSYCGYYKGRQVLDVLAKAEAREEKRRKRLKQAAGQPEGKTPKSKAPLSVEELSKKTK